MQRIRVKFSKWSAEKVEVSADALRATGKMPEYEGTTLFTTEIGGSRTLKVTVLRLDDRQQGYSWIQFGVVFGETDLNGWLHNNENAWCLWPDVEGCSTSLYCRGKWTETKETQIRGGSVLQTTFDCDNKSIVFAFDGVAFPPIKMDVTDLQSRKLCAAVRIGGETQIEMSGE